MKTYIFSFLILVVISFTGCHKPKEEAEEIAFPIKMASVNSADMPLILPSFGTLASPNTVNIKAQVTGEIIQVPFQEGSFVKKNDLLIAIDPSPFLADLQNARAGVLSAIAQAVYAKESYESYKQLREQDFISVIDLANYLKNAEVADASVLANLATLENAKINLGYTQITAPIEGIIGFMGNKEGNIANTSDTLVTVVQVQPLYVIFSLSEQDLWALRQAESAGPVAVTGSFLNKERPDIQGILLAIDNSVNTQTGTILVKATFPNNSLEAWPGEFVKLHLHLKTLPSVNVISKAALQYGQQGPFVYVIDSTMHVSLRNVTLGPSQGDTVAVLQGLKPGENVVTDGQLNLFPGARVYVAS